MGLAVPRYPLLPNAYPLCAAKTAADALVELCVMAVPHGSPEVATGGSSTTGRRGVMAALASQVVEATNGLSDLEASTPKLRFADTAAR